MTRIQSYLIAMLCTVSVVIPASGQPLPVRDGPLFAAYESGNWIRHHQIETEHGLAWPVVPVESEDVARNLYSGTPGVILFFLELGKASGDQTWIDDAKRGADDLLAYVPDDLSAADPGLWTGLAGQGFTLHRAYLATKDKRYLEGAEKCVRLLRDQARVVDPAQKHVRWNDVTDIIGGSAGIGLFLIYAANEMDDPQALSVAMKAGDDLIARGREVKLAEGKCGLKWAMTDEFPRLMPNFSHGTAGVCYFLATLHQELNSRDLVRDDRFLNAAKAGAAYLVSIAATEHGGFKVFHHEPEGEELFYLGWCHGPVGTSRLFFRIGQIDNDSLWSRMIEKSANGVMTSGIPKQRPDGFWENVGPCCGSAGVGSYFLDLIGDEPRQEYVQFALAMNDDIMKRATRVELPDGAIGLKWIHAEHRVRPDFLQAQTGYMQGAAGIGLWLLQLDAFESERNFTLRLPDSPY